ncbi:MAG: hypothetical protein ACLFQP_12375, partial [Halothece sp.]
ASLQQLRQYQDWCFQVIDILNESGLTEVISWQTEQILPSFFRFCAAWKNDHQEDKLLTQLKKRGFHVQLHPLTIQLIPQQSAFIAQYSHLFSTQPTSLSLDSYFTLSPQNHEVSPIFQQKAPQ